MKFRIMATILLLIVLTTCYFLFIESGSENVSAPALQEQGSGGITITPPSPDTK